ncbi:MAG TPA: hypothetical protein VL728_15740 [Cyclobacteriaceae bacterium]|jgi:hypothetical protein|nr:hypothetical protein [Cyclobacteriaceae bacterium]
MKKTFSFCQALIFIVLVINFSCSSKKDPTPVSTKPEITASDKNSAILGDIVTVTGKNFSKNYQGASQLVAVDPTDTTKQFLLIVISRTSTQMTAVVTGATASTVLAYKNVVGPGNSKLYISSLPISVVAPTANQFFVSSTFTANHLNAGAAASFGVKNGSTTAGDYTVKLVGYDIEGGTSTEFPATVTGVDANGYGGSMDKVNFTVPTVASGEYQVKVTYNSHSLVAGYQVFFFVN